MDSTDKYNWFYKLMIKLFSISEEQRYGRKEVVEIAKSYLENKDSAVVVDVAAGQGTDLIAINNNCMGNVELYALEAYMPNIIHLQTNNIKTFQVNLERDKLPFPDSSVDIIVANQILEHCKELFWIIFKNIKTRGYCYCRSTKFGLIALQGAVAVWETAHLH